MTLFMRWGKMVYQMVCTKDACIDPHYPMLHTPPIRLK